MPCDYLYYTTICCGIQPPVVMKSHIWYTPRTFRRWNDSLRKVSLRAGYGPIEEGEQWAGAATLPRPVSSES